MTEKFTKVVLEKNKSQIKFIRLVFFSIIKLNLIDTFSSTLSCLNIISEFVLHLQFAQVLELQKVAQ